MAKSETKGHDKKSKKDAEDEEDEEQGESEALEALKNIDDWDDTEEFQDIEKGKYQCQITGATLNNAKSSGRLQVSWEVTIVSGPHKGRKSWSHRGIDDPDQRSWLRSDLSKLGQEWPSKPSKLTSILEELIDTHCECSISPRKDGDGTNFRFIRALDSDDIEEEEEDEKPSKKSKDDDDDEPKKSKKSKDDDEDEDDAPKSKSKPKSKDDEEDEDEKPSKKSKAKDDEEGDDEVVVKFDDEDLDKDDKKRVKKLADKHDFNPDDYRSLTDLMQDIAEYKKLSGTFKTPEALFEAIEEAD